jgi:deoxycytidylate deaminase
MHTGLKNLFDLRKDFIVIGLTGRTGSGCTSTANILASSTFEECAFPQPKHSHFETNDERKDNILYYYLKKNWKPFKIIKVSSVIVSVLLKSAYEDFKEFAIDSFGIEAARIEVLEIEYRRLHSLRVALDDIGDKSLEDKEEKKIKSYDFHFKSGLESFVSSLKDVFMRDKDKSGFTLLQILGNNIRSSGKALDSDFKYGCSFKIASLINKLVKVLREYGEGRIVVDSIRNSLEANFFKERYSAFYMIAINTENDFRYDRLSASGLNKAEVDSLDEKEYSKKSGKKKFFAQDVKSCIQIADIYIHNPTEKEGPQKSALKKQIAKYISLIQHPGLVTPSPEERCMQIAYTAKYNSGCISRQVGAVVTDAFFSIKALGWNNTAEGQTPCLLRNVTSLINNTDDKAFSKYELNNPAFRLTVINAFKEKGDSEGIEGRNISFCFKDAQNAIEGQKNQVHTRSLHAEENAFLQIAKYGGEGVKGGKLFTTASPCELCSKKAYQIGIKFIYYIDPYPGIAGEQILESGGAEYRPSLVLFDGAIGRAYHQLYEPVMAYKDELDALLDIKYAKAGE